ncbi:TerC/Alx family metal homeostasis membrane protein [Candidatus Gracilibacteria bacterium]|nr:MAG: TerC/Alx family metal homeostasis membrane protein [Candidatus Gracilibacteria bacterium]
MYTHEMIVFGVIVSAMILLDLGLFNKKSHEVKTKEALIRTLVWIGLSMLFAGYVYRDSGVERFSQFLSAYWIEKLLSVDNLFVFVMIFSFFRVEKKDHHKVLFRGVIGALVFRAIFIFTGVKLIQLTYLPEFSIRNFSIKINILLSLFGIFLIYAGIKSFFQKEQAEEKQNFSDTLGAKIVKLIFPRMTDEFHESDFFVIKNGLKYATPLLLVVGVVEFSDILFAVDSIPAIFAIAPNDPFILYASNIFAILGLRSLYFLLANFIDKFAYLKYGIAVILTFIGLKMLLSPVIHFSSTASLIILINILVLSLIISLIMEKKKKKR